MGALHWCFLSPLLGPWLTLRLLSLLLCLSFALVLPVCAETPASPLQGTVTWIYDGDTLKIDPIGKVRLIGIDTPERENSQRDRYLIEQGISVARQRQVTSLPKSSISNRSKAKGSPCHSVLLRVTAMAVCLRMFTYPMGVYSIGCCSNKAWLLFTEDFPSA